MDDKQKEALRSIENILTNIEVDLKRIKLTISQVVSGSLPQAPIESTPLVNQDEEDENVQVVEGEFDGYFMIWSDQKKYPVPMNYASKTKLIPGDKLKLKIMQDGKLIYKLIAPAERKNVKAILSMTDDNKFIGITEDGQTYFLNQAAVTFFKGKPGDELFITINAEGKGGFAAIEAVIQK